MFSFLGAPITFLVKVIFPLPVSITVSEISVTPLFELKKSIALLAVVILPEIFVAPEPLLFMPPTKLQFPASVNN